MTRQLPTDASPLFAAYNDEAIWGSGETVEAARDDAANWMDLNGVRAGYDTAEEGEAAVRERLDGLKIERMSATLAAHVQISGGNCAFTLDDQDRSFVPVLRLSTELRDDA